jgi:superfamily II DNA or RNA helicase
MHIFPTDEEVEQAAGLLVNQYGVSAQLLGQLFDHDQRDQANSILQALGGERLRALDVARLLIQREGPALFSGSKEVTRELRLQILGGLTDKQVEELFERNPPSGTNITAVSRMRRPLAWMKWSSGKRWARDFVVATGFPAIFAGVEQREKVPTIHDVPPLKVPPKLAEFQEGLKQRMRKVLERYGDRTRCVVTLPTGGGKTRVAVEAFIDWMQPRFAAGKYLIWIAQSEELCEQAIACIEQMWGSREFVGPLRIYRFFGGRSIPTDELSGGAVVASIQQLHNRIKAGDEAIEMILKDTGAMIIDEAHRAVSAMYDTLLGRAEEICGPDLFPICGLTATPGRAGLNSSEETVKLVGRFEVYLVKPELGRQYAANPLRYFREHGFLARARHVLYHSGCEYELTDDDLDDMKRENDLPACFLKRLAADRARNLQIIRRLLALPKGTPTLVYACTVDHAYFLAAILTAQGRKAAAVSADTPMTVRRALIQDFKAGNIEFLCNYGVLTTGFDAPKTECIALCRPTTSEVLYEQIIGRGLRGPVFGGTEECTIIDFADNIRRLGPPLAYKRFEDFWTEEEDEGGGG